MRGWVPSVIVAVLLSLPLASAGTDVEAAAGYVYELDVEDPAGDHKGLLGAPNGANPESDILRVEATLDAESFIVRVTMATLDFDVPGVGSVTIPTTGPNGEDWDVQISYGSGGANPGTGDSDPASGDPDVLMPGARAAVDAANNQVYLFADHAATGLQPGQSITIDGVNSGRGVSAGVTLTFTNLDTSDIAGSSLTLPAAGGEGSVAPEMLFENLTTPAFLHEFANATSDDHTLNFTVPWQNATIRQTAAVVSGSANVTVLRDGEVFLSLLLTNQTAPAGSGDDNATADGNGTDLPVLTDAAGDWTVVIDYEGFVGTLGMELAEHVPAPAVEANATEEPVLDANVGEESPGPALPLLVLGLLAAVGAARRRR